ncbi:MAG: hypothetical protein O3A51_04445 [Verrucomicrobia bacterium]|nr:hypothetical protein [Verrucomicrobiota bacterium]
MTGDHESTAPSTIVMFLWLRSHTAMNRPPKVAGPLQAYEESGNPYMVNAGCEIPSGTPAENLRALCEPVGYAP